MKVLIACAGMSVLLSGGAKITDPSQALLWVRRAPLPLARAGYAAGVLPSGLIIAGGSYWKNGKKTLVARVDIYRPDCDCWSRAPAMPAAITGVASAVHNGVLFVFGGSDGHSTKAGVFSFDGKAWKTEPAMKLPEPRTNGMAAVVGTKLFLIGGLGNATNTSSGVRKAWVWNFSDPRAGWKALPAFPGAPRASAAIAAQGNSIVIAGGLRANTSSVVNLRDIWRFDLGQRRWAEIGKLPEGRRAFAAAAIGEEIIFAGGYTKNFDADVLILRNNKIKREGILPEPVADISLLSINGRLYFTGGEIGPKLRGATTWSVSTTLKGWQ